MRVKLSNYQGDQGKVRSGADRAGWEAERGPKDLWGVRWGNDTRAGKGFRQKNQPLCICLKSATIKLNTLQVNYKNQTNKRSIN